MVAKVYYVKVSMVDALNVTTYLTYIRWDNHNLVLEKVANLFRVTPVQVQVLFPPPVLEFEFSSDW